MITMWSVSATAVFVIMLHNNGDGVAYLLTQIFGNNDP